jgi:hypothetical protein
MSDVLGLAKIAQTMLSLSEFCLNLMSCFSALPAGCARTSCPEGQLGGLHQKCQVGDVVPLEELVGRYVILDCPYKTSSKRLRVCSPGEALSLISPVPRGIRLLEFCRCFNFTNV